MKSPGEEGARRYLLDASGRALRVLIVDLNNFSTFPTLAVGLLIASLRNAGMQVRLLSPLANDVPATERERPDTFVDHLARRVHLSTWEPFRGPRDMARRLRAMSMQRPHPRGLKAMARALDERPDVILLSAYLQHRETVMRIGALAAARGVPLVVGGPMFNIDEAAEVWREVPGLTAIIAGEVDRSIPDVVAAVCAGRDLLSFEGVTLPDGRRSRAATPLRPLDEVPTPDFSDFPWDRYRTRIIPIMTGRGCQWNRCTFCSDIISVSGRSFRTRSLEAVLQEMREQARRHQTSDFLFLDLKLNSNPALFRGLIENVQRNVRGAQWIGTVHVDQRKDNGLSRRDLREASLAGLRRVSFGLETGSQRLLDAMDKGCTVERNSKFIHDAFDAGVSVRCTMFKGFPGETEEDLTATARFLEQHRDKIDRIRFNDFSVPLGTPIAAELAADPGRFANISLVGTDARNARRTYVSRDGIGPGYRKAKARVLRAVYEINRREIRSSARVFDGLM